MDNLRSHERGGRDTLPVTRHASHSTAIYKLLNMAPPSSLRGFCLSLAKVAVQLFMPQKSLEHRPIRSNSVKIQRRFLGNRNSRCSASLAKFSARLLRPSGKISALQVFAALPQQKTLMTAKSKSAPLCIPANRAPLRLRHPECPGAAAHRKAVHLPWTRRLRYFRTSSVFVGLANLSECTCASFSDGGNAHKVLNPLSCVLVHWQTWRREQTKFGPGNTFAHRRQTFEAQLKVRSVLLTMRRNLCP